MQDSVEYDHRYSKHSEEEESMKDINIRQVIKIMQEPSWNSHENFQFIKIKTSFDMDKS